jgi:hypothetical protein
MAKKKTSAPEQPSSPASQAALWELWHMLQNTLLEMMRQPEKLNAEKLGIIRSWLRDNGCVVDMTHEADVRASLDQLNGMSVPFNDK